MGVFGRFKSDQDGATAVIFGLAALPLLGLVGATVDYGRAANEIAKLQRAADATALALVREAPTMSASDFQARGRALFASMYTPANGVSMEEATISRAGTVVTVSRSGRMTNAFMQVLQVPTTPIRTASKASASRERIEIALVLDNTGSMNDTIDGTRKIDALKRTAGDLVDELRALATDPDAVRISVVPFDTEVRLDPNQYRYKSFLRWNDPSNAAERQNWTGYVFDRYQPYDTRDDAPVAALPNTLYPKRNRSEWTSAGYGDLATVQPLVSLYNLDDYRSVQTTISGMRPRGNTNVSLGVSWGTATLTGSVPLDTVASTDSRKLRRYMIVLTDGINTQYSVNGSTETVANPGNPSPYDRTLLAINDRTRRACETAKDTTGAAVEVFTIRLLQGDATLLTNCASPPNERITKHYFDVQSKPALEEAFRAILNGIAQTRITS